MPPVENVRGYMAALVAGIAVIGGAIMAVYVWQHSLDHPDADVTLIFGVCTGLIGSGTTFLFMSDAGSRAAHAAERAGTAGAVVAQSAAQQGAAQALAVPPGPVPPVADPVVIPDAVAGVAGPDDPAFPGSPVDPVEDA